jgi:hypothetical protein
MSRAQSTARKTMPKAESIRKFWAPKLSDTGKVWDQDVILEPVVFSNGLGWQCFCCGRVAQLERAHIRALASGGSNDVENIHMLCRKCHLVSEHFTEPAYWTWFYEMEFRGFLDPRHFSHVWRSMGARDETHAMEILVDRFGPDMDVSQVVKIVLREVYGLAPA